MYLNLLKSKYQLPKSIQTFNIRVFEFIQIYYLLKRA